MTGQRGYLLRQYAQADWTSEKIDGWKDQAVCREVDGDLFFPDPGRNDLVREARRVCSNCPVATSCLQWALDHREDEGVWAGTTPGERRVMRGLAPKQRPPKPKHVRECVHCGAEFFTHKSRQVYCSLRCGEQHRRQMKLETAA